MMTQIYFYKFVKILFIIFLFLFLIVNIFPLAKYYFSATWISSDKIEHLEKEAYNDNCEATMSLFRHYKKIFYKTKLSKKWFVTANNCFIKLKGPKIKNGYPTSLKIKTTFKGYGMSAGTIKSNKCYFIGRGADAIYKIKKIELSLDNKIIYSTDSPDEITKLYEMGWEGKCLYFDREGVAVKYCNKVVLLEYD